MTNLLSSRRVQLTVGLLIGTGMLSLILGIVFGDAAWVFPAQIVLAMAFIVATAFVFTPEDGRMRLLAIAAPAVGAVGLGLTVLPQYFGLTIGAAVGWIVAGIFLFRQQTPREVMQAIRHMRKGKYNEAVAEMDTVIKRDADNPEHYRLRGMILRLDGKLGRARKDYERMLDLAPDGEAGDAIRAEAYDGLAEVHLQAKRYDQARAAALAAHELYPDNWVPLYNLGLIHDRMGDAEAVITYLTDALEKKIPDSRQKLLAHLYLARAYNRLGDVEQAQAQAEIMKTLWTALDGLQKLVNDAQSASLSAVLADDVALARDIMLDDLEVTRL